MTNRRMSAVVLAVALRFWALQGAQAQSASTPKASVGEKEHSMASSQCVLDEKREAVALQVLLKSVQRQVTEVGNAMPADKYGFKPTDDEFAGVRTFGQQVKHLAATNFILGAAALGEAAPADAGDEVGPEAARTKAEILSCLTQSFARLSEGIDALGQCGLDPRPSPISPLKKPDVTRESLLVEALIHTFDHYGQMVEYLRMNGVVPPPSIP